MRLLTAIFASLVLAAPAAAEPVTETVKSGNVSAEFSYERDGQDYGDFHVKITHDGAVLWNKRPARRLQGPLRRAARLPRWPRRTRSGCATSTGTATPR